ncbi:MAG: cation:proton antiporter [Phycisphaerales bacterium]
MTDLLIAAAGDKAHDMMMTAATAIAMGAMLIVIARRLGIPAIVLLLCGGIMLGPDFWTRVAAPLLSGLAGHLGAGDDIINWLLHSHAPVQPEALGDGLLVIVSLAIGLILFEGGLTLDITGYREAPTMIKRLLSLGVVVTWFGTTLAIWWIFRLFEVEMSWKVAIISGSLVIVTGPTVIAPLLKRINITSKLHNILHWEGVLIDPLGVFIALLCYEWVSQQSGMNALLNLGIRVGVGLGVGVVGGFLLTTFVRRKLVPEEMVNVFSLGFAVAIFALAELARSETGLLSVTVAGFVFGLSSSSKLKQVKQFKAEITDLLIGMLFILLASRLEFDQFREFGWAGVLAVATVLLVIRPISIFLCSMGIEDMRTREKMLLSWIAPRGIVAASMASLVAINLGDRFVETFTYSVIIATIVLQGSTAGLFARMLGLKREKPRGWMIVGAHVFSRRLAEFITRSTTVPVILIDSGSRAVREARSEGLNAIVADARDISLADRLEFQGIGRVVALTDNEDLNARVCTNWAEVVGSGNVYRGDPSDRRGPGEAEQDEEEVQSGTVVLARLPRPSLLSGEIMRGDSTVIIVDHDAESPAPVPASSIPVLAIESDDDVQFDPDPDGTSGKMMYIHRRSDYLMRSIRPELITTLAAESLPDLFAKLVDRVVKVHPALPREETIDELLERESAFPTVLGHGVAVPHTYSKALDDRICALAQIPEGMIFGDEQGERVELVFLLLSPQGDPEGHLATLAEIARLVIRPDVRNRLMVATSPLEVIRIIREER